MFNDNFVLVLHTYKSHYTYNSLKSNKGIFNNFAIDTSSQKLCVTEQWIRNGRCEIVDGEYVVPEYDDNEELFPSDIKETIYLLIPKIELPNNVSVNGEIDLNYDVVVLE